MAEFFTAGEFETAIAAGGFRRISVIARWSHFTIEGAARSGADITLAKSKEKREARRFLNPAAALKLLRQMGARKAEVEMGQWDLDLASLSMRMRPDVTARRMQAQRNPELAFYGKLNTLGAPNREEEKDKLVQRRMMGKE
jgi:hypothetical protein